MANRSSHCKKPKQKIGNIGFKQMEHNNHHLHSDEPPKCHSSPKRGHVKKNIVFQHLPTTIFRRNASSKCLPSIPTKQKKFTSFAHLLLHCILEKPSVDFGAVDIYCSSIETKIHAYLYLMYRIHMSSYNILCVYKYIYIHHITISS